MTKGRWGATAIILVSMLASASARAQGEASPFGTGHQLVLSTERLFGYVHTSETLTRNGVDATTTLNSIAVFGSPISFGTIYSAPRLALDFFAAERVSLGIAASYFHLSEDVPGGGSSPTFSGFLIAPRAGYGLPLSPLVALWPRLGLTIMRLSLSASGSSTTNDTTVYALTIEAPVMVTIAPHVFFAGGPTVDVGLGGSQTTSGMGMSTSIDEKATSFGVQFSLGGFF